MPTGYTEEVSSGAVTTLEQFALRCARSFSALIQMRDDPLNAPIPNAFIANTTYGEQAIEQALAVIAKLDTMSAADALEAARAAYLEELGRWVKAQAERAMVRMRYESMLEKVHAWTPAAGYESLKEMMIDQLQESLRFDCPLGWDRQPALQDGEVWRSSERAKAQRAVEFHTEQRDHAIERAAERTIWIQKLRDSLSKTNACV